MYGLENGVTMLWMGDLETSFMNNIKEYIDLPEVDILFETHHGRDSGKVPTEMLKQMNPKIVVIGEAPSDKINYYSSYNTIKQLSAGNIIFECEAGKVHIYVSNNNCNVNYLDDEGKSNFENYIGTLML